ncbi:VOC family protein [Streptosporangium sp. NPDC049644]|uniref:VOC family protein n=1 Tax=Streptosporangium sp. NPDC049644 TaxID=3155507 RepID=UPI00341FAE35
MSLHPQPVEGTVKGDLARYPAPAEPVVRLRALRSVSLRSTAVDECVDFYSEAWGLRPTERDRDAAWLRGTGAEHHILQLVGADESGLDKIAFAVATPREIDEAAHRLRLLTIPLITEPGPLDQVGGGYGLRFLDPEGRLIELSCDTYSVTPDDPDGLPAVPRKLAHVVLNTVDIDAACAFYTAVLGMRISDWSEHQMAFLRCNADHHVIAFNQAEWSSINHVAYEMPSIDHFMRGIGRLRHNGVTPLWGPGRHGPGNNTFGYFADPAGLVCEYTSEVEQVEEDAWLCRVWRRVPELSDLWGTAGPPSKDVRRHMAGVPDLGHLSRAGNTGVPS